MTTGNDDGAAASAVEPKRIRVLVVDDDGDHAAIVRGTLERHGGFAVGHVVDGADCLATLLAEPWAVVLLDYSLPRMNGLEVLARIQQLELGIPIVMVTAQGDERVAVLAMHAGAIDYVVKTSGYFTTLPTVLNKVLKQHELAVTNARLYREAQQAYEDLSRTQELLTQAQKMDALGRLAGGIAHDFNNLLTVILGRLDILLEDVPPQDRRRSDVELIAATAERAATLTRQLLSFSRGHAVMKTVVDVNTVVCNVIRLLGRLLGETVELVTSLAPAVGHVRGDPGQLEQIIVNLAVNARDAMPSGGVLTVGTARVDVAAGTPGLPPSMSAGAYVLLTVGDTGQGMDAETRRRVFEPFFTTKAAGAGTGLGLATVYGIVKQHDGHITVDSAAGRGTTFNVYLPSVEAEVTVAPAAVDTPPRGHETILLVEDEREVRLLVRDVLRASGYEVIEAETPKDAVRLASDWPTPIDLLVTDVVMPEMGGRAVAEAVRALRPAIKTLFISGYTGDATGNVGELQGPGRAFLEKPFTGRTLTRKVRETIDRA